MKKKFSSIKSFLATASTLLILGAMVFMYSCQKEEGPALEFSSENLVQTDNDMAVSRDPEPEKKGTKEVECNNDVKHLVYDNSNKNKTLTYYRLINEGDCDVEVGILQWEREDDESKPKFGYVSLPAGGEPIEVKESNFPPGEPIKYIVFICSNIGNTCKVSWDIEWN